jgi:rubrerythrin
VPFRVAPGGSRAPRPRGLHTTAGIGDRLRTAAFAEIQARDAFLWAADRFDARDEVRNAWRRLAREEDKHLGWLLARMSSLGETPDSRRVSDQLWRSLLACTSAAQFASHMAGAEDWGREAGQRLGERLEAFDAESAALFAKIAREEVGHIQLARRFFPRDQALPAVAGTEDAISPRGVNSAQGEPRRRP